jgi:hypothetical protein
MPACGHAGKRNQIVGFQLGQRAVVLRHHKVAVASDKTVAGKVLAARGHATLLQATLQGQCQFADNVRVAMEGPVADDGTAAPVQVQHRGEGQVDTAGAQFASQHHADIFGGGTGGSFVLLPQFAQHIHGRQTGEAIEKTLYAATFVVNGNQQFRRTQLRISAVSALSCSIL